KILLPVTPESVHIGGKGQNKKLTLISDEEINILKKEGLKEIKFEALLPNAEYPFAKYKDGFKNAKYFLDEIEKLRKSGSPFQFKIVRMHPSGELLFNTNLKMAIEDISVQESARNGLDVILKVELKEYRDYGTKVATIIEPKKTEKPSSKTTVIKTKAIRPDSPRSPAPRVGQVKTHTVAAGDSLWAIAKKFYGDGSKYQAIVDANKDQIVSASLIHPNQVLVIPPI
ncbi:MAG: LysM peptidoglycan-binding domain-containing protein, partial [Bacillota bacterium]|nr:LysM peptidoglycan-binding domain-containing protein [Bacillota bacterium]